MSPLPPIVVLTREPPDNTALAARLHDLGLQTREYPCIKTAFLTLSETNRGNLEGSDVLAFTSRRGVHGFARLRTDPRLWPSTVAAVGPSTAAAVEEVLGRAADLVPPRTGARALGEVICRHLAGPGRDRSGRDRPGGRVLHIRGTLARESLGDVLKSCGHLVDEWTVYQTEIAAPEPLTGAGPCVIVLASPSAVDGFETGNRVYDPRFVYVTIGPETTDRLVQRGGRIYREAERATTDGLVEAIRDSLEDVTGRPS